MDWLLEMYAHYKGLSDSDIAILESEVPATAKLLDTVKQNEQLFQQLSDLYTKNQAPLKQAAILIPEVASEVAALQPGASIIIQLLERQKAAKLGA